mmetsp:Transcript_8857/g.24035  ORF Transcript_8857/g.24035 Transcript_8857/m.24035 type:complete len:148 (-) Transcript_8857:694-1137(-)
MRDLSEAVSHPPLLFASSALFLSPLKRSNVHTIMLSPSLSNLKTQVGPTYQEKQPDSSAGLATGEKASTTSRWASLYNKIMKETKSCSQLRLKAFEERQSILAQIKVDLMQMRNEIILLRSEVGKQESVVPPQSLERSDYWKEFGRQ